MNRTWLGLGWLFGLVFLLCTVGSGVVHSQVRETPETLVLRFEPSAASLDQPGVRAAIAQELQMTLADSGSEQAATLIVGMVEGGDVQVTYRPDRQTLTRSVPIASTSDVPRLIAQLAGNMVRSEANSLIAELQPEAATPTPANSARTIPPPPPASTTSANANANAADGAPPSMQQSYLHDAWIFSVLGGGGLSLVDDDPSFGNLVLQLSKRMGRFEIGAGARFAYGNMRIVARTVLLDEGIFAFSNVAIGYQVTLPVSVEYRVLGDQRAYLQLGAAAGLRLSGVMNQSRSITSGSDPYVMLGVQATAGFALADQHGVMLRVGWDILPVSHHVNTSDGEYELEPLPFGVQLGWQIGW